MSAAICERTVSTPWPTDAIPTWAVKRPSASATTRACSKMPGLPISTNAVADSPTRSPRSRRVSVSCFNWS
jgi:hypothetical protein